MYIKAVFLQGIPLPFGKRLNNFDTLFRHLLHLKGDRTFNSVEVIVETALLCDKQRRTDPGKIHFPAEFLLKCIADIFNCFLSFTNRQYRIVSLWSDHFHNSSPLYINTYFSQDEPDRKQEIAYI